MEKFLLVEDESYLRDFIAKNLEDNGYEVIAKEDGFAAWQVVLSKLDQISLCVFDINLPGIDGVELCRKLRYKASNVPVVMLTNLASTRDIIRSFDAGADDYVIKPFIAEELTARCRTLLRKSVQSAPKSLKVGEIFIDLSTREVSFKGRMIDLRRQEYNLLVYLLQNQNMIVSRQQILNHCWPLAAGSPVTTTVDVHVRALRQKFGDSGKDMIKTIPKFGYKLCCG